ncbi:MAG: outer membrane protein assembly factor BamD [Candidatus Marinimicrobia bacterium]|nr:outer membrane protein assembly factor BamD [Candidatus Neomarinimicrobiota bacterium]MCF7851004.1 outer membrane protein assembly factor BamD [Candidatus Neomarinimicrobiota bacterium]MCF7904942.1 outer membrane protein assembly factor BamD [Candidatus Neomarinimicrobiota bacterium]
MIIRSIQRTLIIFIIALIMLACSSQKETLDAQNIGATFERGMSYLEKENYLKAEETFTFIIYNDPGGAFADDAQFYLAETFYLKEEYLLAISEYDRLIRRMKNSSFVEHAFWRKAEAYCELSPDFRLETDMTEKALRYLYDFVEIYPESKYSEEAELKIIEMREKLARKLLETARLYDTLHEYESAIYYYDTVIEEYADTKLHAAAKLGKAGDLVMLGTWDEARDLLTSIAESGRNDLSPLEVQKLKRLGTEVLEHINSGNN